MSQRPAPRKSGRAPKRDDSEPPTALDSLERDTLEALRAAVFLQNMRKLPDVGPKSRHLSDCVCDLEMALIDKQPKEITDPMCIDIAALVLRIREQGDGH